jgi:hypothetical protein
VAQLRQAFDVGTGQGLRLASFSTVFLGYRPTPEVALGLEGWSVSILRGAPEGAPRTTFTFAPGVRFFYRWVEPAIHVVVPIGTPLLGAADGWFGLRVDVRVWMSSR